MLETLKKYVFPIAVAILIVVFLLIGNSDDDQKLHQADSVTEKTEPDAVIAEEDVQAPPTNVVIDVKGEVASPGVYEIKAGSRVNEVIQMAGGFTEDADQSTVNLAQKVQDEMIVLIPEASDEIASETPEDLGNVGNDKIRLNNATQEEIEGLNGIGPSKAQAIIQYRDENGLFQSVDDLLNVSGIGDKTLASLRDDIQIP